MSAPASAARLAGRAALVTGGGTGIGAGCAARLAAEGAHVTVMGRTEATLAAVVERITSAGHSASLVVGDVTDEDSVSAAVADAAAHRGRLDVVVANAGGGGGMGPYHRQDLAEFTRVLQLNVVGTMLLAKHALPHLVSSGVGSFVAMSSIAAGTTHPYFGAYPVAKAGIDQIVRNAADEYGYANVRFNSVRPGFVATEIMQGIPQESETYQSYVANTPLGRLGEPEDVAAVVAFLASDEARWVTGQVFAVDGGHSLRRGPDFGPLLEMAFGPDSLRL